MAKSYRIGVLGLTHDHVWSNLKDVKESGKAVLVAAADSHPPLLEQVKQQYGCTVYPDYYSLINKESLDAVYIYCDNATGVQLAQRVAEKGWHILIEKPMADRLEGAEDMLAAVRKSGVRLMVNWPFAWWPQLRKALELAKSGAIGDVWQVKYRAAHAGPREIGCSPYFCEWLYDSVLNGAGALMDYCCYGAVLARHVLGMPSRVTGVAGRLCKEDIVVEDNAVLLLSYSRALAMAEGSWTQIDKMSGYLTAIYGTRGTLLVEPRQAGQLVMATAGRPEGSPVELTPVPAHMKNATAHFLHGLDTGESFFELCSDRLGRDVQEILEAGLQSVARGQEVSLPLKNFLDSV
jgi:predicted dehydrogenase